MFRCVQYVITELSCRPSDQLGFVAVFCFIVLWLRGWLCVKGYLKQAAVDMLNGSVMSPAKHPTVVPRPSLGKFVAVGLVLTMCAHIYAHKLVGISPHI